MNRAACPVAAIALLSLVFPGGRAAFGQGYRLRLDARAQTVSYRGVTLDSIAASDTISGPTGPATSNGFAVSCLLGSTYCGYFRPGAVERAAPMSTTADLTLWGLGLTGVSVHATSRVTGNFGSAQNWPGTSPAFQLLEGYAQYARDDVGPAWLGGVTGQLGRQIVATRLGYTGFDGARVALRDASSRLEATGYAGWGLARAIALPVTNAALNPLDEFRPQQRQLVAGAGAGWMTSRADLRANYLREVDPQAGTFVSERAGVDVMLRPHVGWSISGGSEYDIAAGLWGSAESTVRFAPAGARMDATLGVQRYRPHFDLWTIWGAFSPVPFRSVQGSVSYAPISRLRLRARGQRYEFDDADVSTPLVTYETKGWRFSSGATYTLPRWTIDAGYHAEFGPGASSRGVEGAVTVAPSDSLLVTLFASALDRPLEFRFVDASLRSYGMNAEYRATSRLHLQVEASGFSERRDRTPFDAAAFDWNQVRVSARVTLLLGNAADLAGLPPAVQRMPGGRSARGRTAASESRQHQ